MDLARNPRRGRGDDRRGAGRVPERRPGRTGAARAVSGADSVPARRARTLLLPHLLGQRGGPAVLRPGHAVDVRLRQGRTRCGRSARRGSGIRTAPSATGARPGPGAPISTGRCGPRKLPTPMPPSRRRGRWPARDMAAPRERDYIDALSVRYVESFDVAKRREQDEAYAAAMKALSERYPDDLDAATPVRRGAVPARAAPGHAGPERPQRPAAAWRARRRPGAVHRASRRLSPLRPCHRIDGRAREGGGVRRASGERHSRRQPHQPHAVATPGTRSAVGRTGSAPTSGPGTRI